MAISESLIRTPEEVEPSVPPHDQHDENEHADSSSSQSQNTEAKTVSQRTEPTEDQAPPLPEETIPPLPEEHPPDDGWDPVWDASAQAYYFYNRITQKTQWENPRIVQAAVVPGLGSHERSTNVDDKKQKRVKSGGYNPAIHGDYDPNADYAQVYEDSDEDQDSAATAAAVAQASGLYETAGAFNRFTGKWQAAEINPDNHNDENKSKRQMSAFFDVDAAANSHDGKSLKAERQNKKFSKKEIKAFKEKRRDRKEEKRRAWLRD